MALTRTSYIGGLVTIPATLASLAAGAARETAPVDNTANRYLDAQLECAFQLAAGTPAAGSYIQLFLAASIGGTLWTDNATNADADIVLRSQINLIQLATIYTPDPGAIVWKAVYAAIAASFGGGILPPFWKLVVANFTNLPFAASGHSIQYQGVKAETF